MKPGHKIITAFAVLALFLSMNAATEENDDKYLLSSNVYETVSSARELMEKNEHTQAEAKLTGLLTAKINQYEKAVVYQTLGYVYIAMDNPGQATTSFIKSVEGDALPPEITHDINFIIAQLLLNDDKPKESLGYLITWLAKEMNPEPEAHILAATIYYRLGDYRSMIPHIQNAINKSSKPEQIWHEMLLAAYYETNDHNNAAGLLEKMIKLYPEKDIYWLQLAGTYQFIKQYKKSLAIYELALKKNILGEPEIIQLVHLYLNEELPYKAAKLLTEELNSGRIKRNAENLELLANSWILAKEYNKATQILTELASIKNDPELYYRLGQIYFEQEKWADAITALERATQSNNISNIAEAYLLLGIAAYHNNETTRSAKALNQAVTYKNTKAQAVWWLNKLGDKKNEEKS